MHRYGQIINLKPERVEEYKKLHAEVWTDVIKAIAKSNIKNYSIYLKNDILFAYFEYHRTQFEKDMAEMAANPVIQNGGVFANLASNQSKPDRKGSVGQIWRRFFIRIKL